MPDSLSVVLGAALGSLLTLALQWLLPLAGNFVKKALGRQRPPVPVRLADPATREAVSRETGLFLGYLGSSIALVSLATTMITADGDVWEFASNETVGTWLTLLAALAWLEAARHTLRGRRARKERTGTAQDRSADDRPGDLHDAAVTALLERMATEAEVGRSTKKLLRLAQAYTTVARETRT